jgi:hypothetical protein
MQYRLTKLEAQFEKEVSQWLNQVK